MKLYRCMVAALGAADEGGMPEWYLIFREGESTLEAAGTYLVDRAAWEAVKAGLDRRGVEIVVDYEHQSLSGGKAPAAGWCRDWRYTDGVGIEAKIDWTEEAAGYLATSQYRYFSPVFYVNKRDGRLVGIESLALTNTPKTNHLKPLLAKLGAQQQQEEAMLKKLLAKLGLGEDATEEQALAAIDSLGQQTTEAIPAEVTAALELDGQADTSTVVASIHALKQAPRGMVARAEFEALQQQIAKRDADEAVDAAMRDGKVTPDMKDWATAYAERDLSGFKTYCAKVTPIVPVKPLGDMQRKTDDAEVGEAVLKVAKMFGNSEDDIKKYGA